MLLPSPKGPLKKVVWRGRLKDVEVERLECEHLLFELRGKPERRRCPDCLKELRSVAPR